MTPEVTVVGELLWDHHADGALETAKTFVREPGGAVANVALALQQRGIEVAAMAVLGEGALGEGLALALAEAGIDTSAIARRRGQSGSVFIEAPDAARQGGQRFFSYRPTVRWPKRPRLPAAWRRGSLAGKVVHVSAVNPDELGVMAGIAERVTRRGAAVTVDVNARPRAWRGVRMTRARRVQLSGLLARATWVKASVDDLDVLSVGVDRHAIGLSAKGTLIVTRGPGRMSISGPWGELGMRPLRVDAGWSIGAGDAFSASLVEQTLDGAPTSKVAWRNAVRAASVAAAEHLTSRGAALDAR